MNPFELIGKTILITGASSGIGKETAIQCSNMGANVIVTARNAKRLDECFRDMSGNQNVQIIADLTKRADIENIVNEIPKIDGLVLCAGNKESACFPFSTKDKIDDVFNINFYSPLELLRLIVNNDKLRSGGSVVFVSSVGGTHSFQTGGLIYGVSKAAITSAMKFCARELSSKKIRVNCVTPAKVKIQYINEDFEEDKKIIELANYPLGRYGEPKDIAYGIIYLLSNASAWVTGQSLVIDGGKTLN